MEKDIRISGPEGNGIYGRLSNNGHNKIVIHVHGMTHHARYYLEVTSSEFFETCGYDHYRMSLYERAKDSHKPDKSTLLTNVMDIQAVLDYFKDAYDEIYITGHSLGALAVMILNPRQVNAISLWDPATDVGGFWATGPYLKHIPEQKAYHLDYGNVFVIGESMVDEIKTYDNDACLGLAQRIVTPVQFVIPEESIALATPKIHLESYGEAFGGPFELRRIPGANHVFSNRGNREALFTATYEWFEQHKRQK